MYIEEANKVAYTVSVPSLVPSSRPIPGWTARPVRSPQVARGLQGSLVWSLAMNQLDRFLFKSPRAGARILLHMTGEQAFQYNRKL